MCDNDISSEKMYGFLYENNILDNIPVNDLSENDNEDEDERWDD